MKIKKDKILHLVVGLAIFLVVWQGIELMERLEWIGETNGIWYGFGANLLSAFCKEINDQFGFIKFLLTNKEKKTTVFDPVDVYFTVGIPFIWMIVYYIKHM